jgi:hypothetical protein
MGDRIQEYRMGADGFNQISCEVDGIGIRIPDAD